jgi:hypothetical protein
MRNAGGDEGRGVKVVARLQRWRDDDLRRSRKGSMEWLLAPQSWLLPMKMDDAKVVGASGQPWRVQGWLGVLWPASWPARWCRPWLGSSRLQDGEGMVSVASIGQRREA